MVTEHWIESTIAALREELLRRDESLLDRFPIKRYVATVDSYPLTMPYRAYSPELATILAAIAKAGGQRAVALYHKLALATFIERGLAEVPRRNLPNDVKGIYGEWFDRVAADFSRLPDDFYDHTKDLFCKDLAVISLRMIPIGFELIEHSQMGRRYLIGGGPRQLFRAIRYALCKAHAFNPVYYQRHMDIRLVKDFTPEGLHICLLRLAELCRRNPDIAGIAAASWFFDPAVRHISPRLASHQRVPKRGGAEFFRLDSNEAAVRLATAKSETRKRLCEEGKYKPTHYLYVWHRKDLISWAERQMRPFNLAMGGAALTAKIEEFTNDLEHIDRNFFKHYPIELYIEEIRDYPPFSMHRYTSPMLVGTFAAIAAAYGHHALALYHRLAICIFMKDSTVEIKNRRLPDSVFALYRKWFERIFDDLSRLPDDFYDHLKDTFCKDLAVVSLRLIPVGFLVAVSGPGKGFLIEGGIRQFFSSLLYALFVMRGIRPFYGMHLDQRYLKEYWSPEGWHVNYLRIAELLELNPGIKGLCGQSWFYDPALEEISPSIAHISRVPLENGGSVFRIRTTEQTLRLAVKNSPWRMQLSLEGRYRPMHYALVWPRAGILRWAKRHRNERKTT